MLSLLTAMPIGCFLLCLQDGTLREFETRPELAAPWSQVAVELEAVSVNKTSTDLQSDLNGMH